MKQPENVTLRDVAREAGVSVRTVSNVVANSGRVAEATRARVEAAVQRLSYQPNRVARTLRTGRVDMIGLALPDLTVPYFSELTAIVIDEARQHGLTVLVEQTEGLPDRERALLGSESGGPLVAGLILSPLTITPEEVAVAASGLPVVLLGERESAQRLDHVAVDNVAAAEIATRHLIERGCRKIAVIGYEDDPRLRTAHLRAQGFEQAMQQAGMTPEPAFQPRVTAFHRADGAEAMRYLLDLPERPDAVFCFNDLLALGAIHAAREARVRVPQDVLIVGFDDIEDGRYSLPTLTTIRPDKHEIARLAVRTLVERIGGTPGKPREYIAPFSLEIRESSTSLRRFRSSLSAR